MNKEEKVQDLEITYTSTTSNLNTSKSKMTDESSLSIRTLESSMTSSSHFIPNEVYRKKAPCWKKVLCCCCLCCCVIII